MECAEQKLWKAFTKLVSRSISTQPPDIINVGKRIDRFIRTETSCICIQNSGVTVFVREVMIKSCARQFLTLIEIYTFVHWCLYLYIYIISFCLFIYIFATECNINILWVTVFDTENYTFIHWCLWRFLTLIEIYTFIHLCLNLYIYIDVYIYTFIFIHCSVRAFCQGCNNKILCVTVVDTSWNLYIFSLSPKFNTRFTWKFENI